MKYTGNNEGHYSQKRVRKLKEASGIDHCMVEGCSYGATLDVHRLVPGRSGGRYAIGNMFLVCPNHHAEEHRGIGKLVKAGDFALRFVK